MRTEDLVRPTVPVTYARLVLEAAEAHGVPGARVLREAGIAPPLPDDPNERLSVLDIANLMDRTIDLTGAPQLGYEMALGSSLMSHGIMGFGMMTASSLREAIELGVEFLHLRVPVLSAELRVDGDVASVAVAETVPLGDLRQVLLDLFLVKLVRIGESLTEHRLRPDEVEIWFDYPEPAYHAAFRDLLPPMSFSMGANELRFPAALLDERPDTADPVNVKLVEDQCRRELARVGLADDLVAQVRAVLHSRGDGYPTLAEAADLLHTSTRTLKRRLRDHGTSFHELLDAARQAEAIRLLATTTTSVEQVAHHLGYADARSFRRAFQTWTGRAPSAFRSERQDQRSDHPFHDGSSTSSAAGRKGSDR